MGTKFKSKPKKIAKNGVLRIVNDQIAILCGIMIWSKILQNTMLAIFWHI
jgi:hypothetical protein